MRVHIRVYRSVGVCSSTAWQASMYLMCVCVYVYVCMVSRCMFKCNLVHLCVFFVSVFFRICVYVCVCAQTTW